MNHIITWQFSFWGLSRCCWSLVRSFTQMGLKYFVPLVHTVDLMFILFLTRTSSQVTFGPFPEASSDLFRSNRWIFTIVPENIISVTSITLCFSGKLWATMGKIVFIIVAASLVTTVEVTLHTFSIVGELVYLFVLRWKPWKPVVEKLFREISQTLQSMEGVSWWDLLVLSWSKGQKKSWWKFHFSFFLLLSRFLWSTGCHSLDYIL